MKTFTLKDALAALRSQALAAPGNWKAAESEGEGLTLAWIASPPTSSTPEALRVTRRFVLPVSKDLERIAANLPASVEIGPIELNRTTSSLTLGLRPASGRTAGTICDRCGARPRFGTRLYGDAQRCAICSLWDAEDERSDRGSTLIGVLLLLLLLSIVVAGTLIPLESAERARGSRSQIEVMDAAGRSTLVIMTERLRSLSALRLGALDAADVSALNLSVSTLPARAGVAVDASETGYRVVAVREADPIPDDATITDMWTDQPRLRYSRIPRPQGVIAARTLEIEMRVVIRGQNGAQRTMTRTAAISRIPAFAHALYASGTTVELCSQTGRATIAGAVRADALAAFLSCDGYISIAGSVDARDGIRNDDPRNHLLAAEGSIPIPSWSRAAAETAGNTLLANTGGQVRIMSAHGGAYEDGRAQSDAVAGTGECDDRTGNCAGNGYFAPGIVLQRTTQGAAASATVTCGPAYGYGAACQSIAGAAVRYHPWPWTAPLPGGAAVSDPARPGRLWRGLLFDPRREQHCTATVAGNVYLTHRCPSNTFGWLVDAGALPPIAGGLIYFRAAAIDAPGRAAAGAQEAVVIRNAERLAGAMTIVSDLPVFVIGSMNTSPSAAWRGPPPLMIDAPRITVLPAEADVQLGLAPGTEGWASIWDVVPPAGAAQASALPLVAASNVTLFAVLRTRPCARNGAYTGGLIDHSPATLGDWSTAELRLVGAAELYEVAGMSPAICRWWGDGSGAAADGSPWRVPAARTILYDPRLNHPAFAVPGSYLPANIPASGVAGAARRDPARQARATGGYGVFRITQETGRRNPRAAASFPAWGTIPSPPAPLPR